uniref:Poly [ADP-ribose] polymerase n=1 Tax=Anser cygnoides TaxID=8845 RepID=A0A8B9EDL1_ANSCY
MPCPSGVHHDIPGAPGCDNSLSPTRGTPRSPALSPCHPGTQGTTCARHDAHKATRCGTGGMPASPRPLTSCCCREYGTIDDVDIDLHVNISFLDVSPRGTGGVPSMGCWWGVPWVPWIQLGSPWLSLGRRRWRQRGRCFGRSPSSCACASPSPSTSMAPVSGAGQSGRPRVPVGWALGDERLALGRTVHRGLPAIQQGGLRAGSAAEEVRAETPRGPGVVGRWLGSVLPQKHPGAPVPIMPRLLARPTAPGWDCHRVLVTRSWGAGGTRQNTPSLAKAPLGAGTLLGHPCHLSARILGMFTSQQWKHLSNDFLKTQQEKRHSWFKTSGTIKKFRAGLSIFSPIPKSPSFPVIPDSVLKGKLGAPEVRVNRLMNRSVSCTVKNPKGEVFGYAPSTQAGVAPFNILVGGHCKNVPTLEYGFLVQIMKYAEQRIPTLNEYCVVCDEQHVFQNGSMLKPAVCTRELCVFSFYTLGVMSGAAEEVATGAEVVDLLVAMCRAALESPRKSIIFEPYPSVVDPNDPKTLAFNPKKKNYERLQKALDSVMSIREMTQGSYLEIKKQMDKLDPLAHPLLQWIISSNRSHIVKLPLSRQLKFMHTSHQFLLLSSPPAKEARFRTAKKLYGSTFAFHGSHIENWHSILRNGLVNASYTKLQLHGAAYGKGIYLSPISSISFGYSGKRLPAPLHPACAPTPLPAWARGCSVPCRLEELRGNRVLRPPGRIPHPSSPHQPLPPNPGLSDAPFWSPGKKIQINQHFPGSKNDFKVSQRPLLPFASSESRCSLCGGSQGSAAGREHPAWPSPRVSVACVLTCPHVTPGSSCPLAAASPLGCPAGGE